MNPLIQELATKARIQMCSDARLEEFANLVLDECILKLLDMDEKTQGSHNLYKHAAIQLSRHFRDKNE